MREEIEDQLMSPRTFGILMLFYGSAMAGAGYTLRANLSLDRTLALAQSAESGAAIQRSEAVSLKTAVQPERPIRMILASPYEIRSEPSGIAVSAKD